MKRLYCIVIGALIFAFPTIAFAGTEHGIMSMAKGIVVNLLQGNLAPRGRPIALSLLFVAMTAVWLFRTKKTRAFTPMFGPIGLFFAIYNFVVGMGVEGWASFLWNLIWNQGILTGIVLLLITAFILQNFAMKVPGYLVSSVIKTISETKRLAKGVNADEKEKKEPWPWIVIGGITVIGWVIKPSVNAQNLYAPLILSGLACAFTIFCHIFKWKKGRWPWPFHKMGTTTQPTPPTPTPVATTQTVNAQLTPCHSAKCVGAATKGEKFCEDCGTPRQGKQAISQGGAKTPRTATQGGAKTPPTPKKKPCGGF